MPKQTNNRKVNVTYPERLHERLQKIRENTDKNSLSEVFREALKFYVLAHEEHEKGSDFLIRSAEGETERLVMFPK